MRHPGARLGVPTDRVAEQLTAARGLQAKVSHREGESSRNASAAAQNAIGAAAAGHDGCGEDK